MAQDTLKEKVDALNAKRAAAKALEAKGRDNWTEGDLDSYKSLLNDCKNLKGQVDSYNDADALKTGFGEIDDFLKKPHRGVPFDGSPAGAERRPGTDGAALKAGRFELVGVEDGGYSLFENVDGRQECVYEDGAGIYGERTLKAIIRPEYKRAYAMYLRRGVHKMPANALKVLEEGLDDQGGYTVPIDTLVNRVIERKPTPTRLRGKVASVNTSREWLEMMKLNYASDNIYSTGFRVTKTGENPAAVSSAQVTDSNLFGTIKIPVHTFMIRGLLTLNQVEDSALNLLEWVSGKFAQTIEILYDDKILNGTGRMEPRGMLTSVASSSTNQAAGLGGTDDPLITYVPSGDASNLTPDGLINCSMDVPEQYEDACEWVFNKVSTFKQIRAFKDLNDRYLFGAGTQDSGLATPYKPTDLVGYPYVFSGLMPNVGANNYPVLFGDLQGYQFVNRLGFSIQVVREPYIEVNQVAVVGRVRFGGITTEPWRLRVNKCAVS